MKKFLLYLSLCCALQLMAQRKVSTPPMAFDMDATRLPANINYIPGTLEFIDESNDSTIDANEQCMIRFQISNTGLGDGVGCVARIAATGNTQGILFNDFDLPTIKHSDSMWVEYPITSNQDTEEGKVHFKMEIYEPHGLGTGEISYDVPTFHFVLPDVKVKDYVILGQDSIKRKESFTLRILVQNLGQAVAHDVEVEITIPEEVNINSANKIFRIDRLLTNESKIIEYSLTPTVNAPKTIDFLVSLSEKYNRYAEARSITLTLGDKVMHGDSIGTTKKDGPIDDDYLKSKVDRNIPKTNVKNTKTWAFIIANEDYQDVADVPYAINDGEIFHEYCIQTLGIPKEQVAHVCNATGNQIKGMINRLHKLSQLHPDDHVIFYYTGHGFPDESNRTAYLLPVDGISTDLTTGYKLDDLYAVLGKMSAKQVTVFIDACFSGNTRNDGKEMLVEAKGVAIKARSGMPQGNTVVFSAAQGDEPAYPYHKEKHSMFTYFLLEKLQATNGDVTLYELSQYIQTEVRNKTYTSYQGKIQTPCVSPSASLDDSWREWKLK